MIDDLIDNMNHCLLMLREKYGVQATGCLELPDDKKTSGVKYVLRKGNETINLLPWRVERRFIELRNLLQNRTLEDLSTLRFSSFANGLSMAELLYRELELCEWIGDSSVKSLFAVFGGDAGANLIIKLHNGISCSIECGNRLPAGSRPVDRHELIARRGIASDRTVDSQIPQSSIYLFSETGKSEFTDIDAELFELEPESSLYVRAAFAALRSGSTASLWNKRHSRIMKVLDAALSGKLSFFEKENSI